MGLDDSLQAVVDPELGRTLGTLGMIRAIEKLPDSTVVTIAIPPGYPKSSGEELRRLVVDALSGGDARSPIEVRFRVMEEGEQSEMAAVLSRAGTLTPSVRVVGIASGKGGVGKSTVTVNLAAALVQRGRRVGVLDADVYGFSVPAMLGVSGPPMAIDRLVVPPRAHGVRCMSMDYFVPDGQPVIWRGPMLHKALQQFVSDTWWGDVDIVLVDMPPGTGDVTLTMSESLSASELLVVTTPQPAAKRVAQRSAWAARKLRIPVRGVIENMSWFTADDGSTYELFGAGGGAELAGELGVPLLGQIPLEPALRAGGDRGIPVVVAEPESASAKAFFELADAVDALKPARRHRPELAVR
jgi:ATP-binding protein involved in chromosome partitioning